MPLSREGHRQRVKDTYRENGITGMADANLLELILFYAIPRKDTKQLAYDILNHFNGRLDLVFEADLEELETINGIGESAAILISLFRAVSSRLSERQNESVQCLDDYREAKAYCRNLLANRTEEQLLLITLDNDLNIINVHNIASGTVNMITISSRRILEYVLRDKSAAVIITHNHPHGSFKPSTEDIQFTQRLNRLLKQLGIRLADHIIVGENGSLAMKYDIRYTELFE